MSSVSFSIPTHGIFAIIGRNGAGKTTLARILSTLLEPSSGRASIDGLDVMADANRLRNRIAVVPQEGRTVYWMTPVQTVSTYLMWRGVGYNDSMRRAREAVVQVGMGEQADRLNRTLSGGMKRKVLVAMVLVSDAQYHLLGRAQHRARPHLQAGALAGAPGTREGPLRDAHHSLSRGGGAHGRPHRHPRRGPSVGNRQHGGASRSPEAPL